MAKRIDEMFGLNISGDNSPSDCASHEFCREIDQTRITNAGDLMSIIPDADEEVFIPSDATPLKQVRRVDGPRLPTQIQRAKTQPVRPERLVQDNRPRQQEQQGHQSNQALQARQAPQAPYRVELPPLSTEQYVQSEVNGGIKKIIQIIGDFEASREPFERIEIKKLIEKFKEASISVNSLKALKLEISKSEAGSFNISDYNVSILRELGVINDDFGNLSRVPFVFTSPIGVKYFANHFNNLIVVQKPTIVKGKIVSSSFYYFRIVDNLPSLFREDLVINNVHGKQIEKNLVIPNEILSRYSYSRKK